MIITGLKFGQFESIVSDVSKQYADNLEVNDYREFSGNRFRVTIRAKRSGAGVLPPGELLPGARRSWNGRRLTAACWHAHRDVLRAVFDVNPQAKVYTAMARYIGEDGFETNYPDTAYQNIGSYVQPAYMPECCDC